MIKEANLKTETNEELKNVVIEAAKAMIDEEQSLPGHLEGPWQIYAKNCSSSRSIQ